ncbi:MAG TPA: adenylate/guanylate cyclase domain-containing protein [Verrucomicrobiota bacterium]|nr:adenylate/guanylate cyclase domain-containing protein [Verrucomicrobiota bacterium]
MLRPGFRLKLVTAMMTVVLAATGAALAVAQARLREAYRRVAEAQFRAEFDEFTRGQAARLALLEERSLNLVGRNVRLRAALEERDAELLQAVAADELRALRTAGDGPERAVFVRFFDAAGQPLALPDEPATDHAAAGGRLVAAVLGGGPAQRVGLFALPAPGGAELYEAVATRVGTDDDALVFGALLVAFPAALPETGPAGPLRFGIAVSGRFLARPGVFSAEETRLLSALPAETANSRGNLDRVLELAGRPHRAFAEALRGGADPLAPPWQVGVYDLTDSLRQQARLRRQFLGLGAAALAGALGLSLVLAHGLSVPIRELVAGTREVRGGRFDTQVLVRSRDELGQLAGAFNEMTAGLALKERYRTILNTVADEQVARQLLEGGLALGGEVRRVSVLFCDIRGFTAHTENMAPAEVIELLNEHMTALTAVVKRRGGVVDKFVGDLLMALFGAPVTRPDDALEAARCALGILAERRRLNATSRHALEVGIGLATGDVVAGCMGSADRLNYTVLGERVNLASRLCGIAAPGQVVMDETTRAALGDRAEVRVCEPVKLKGFTAPVPAFQLLTLRGEPAA